MSRTYGILPDKRGVWTRVGAHSRLALQGINQPQLQLDGFPACTDNLAIDQRMQDGGASGVIGGLHGLIVPGSHGSCNRRGERILIILERSAFAGSTEFVPECTQFDWTGSAVHAADAWTLVIKRSPCRRQVPG